MRVPKIVPVLLLLALAVPERGAAQTVRLPAFLVEGGSTVSVDVAGDHGGMHFVTRASLRRFTTAGVENAARNHGRYGNASVASDGQGRLSVVVGGYETFSRDFDNAGNPLGLEFQVTSDEGFTNGVARIGGLAAGSAILFAEPTLFIRVAGQTTEVDGGPLQWDVASTPSGGVVVGWTYYHGGPSGMSAQIFDASGTAVAPAFSVAVPSPYPGEYRFTLSHLAMSPDGAVIAAVGLLPGASDVEVVAYRFTATGTMLGAITVDRVASPIIGQPYNVLPDVGFDFAGNMCVVWGEKRAPATNGVWARAFDPSGVPFGPSLRVATQVPLFGVETDVLPDGAFANAWTSADGAWANVVSLCASGSAVCGDGVVVPACERCDDGAGNDDAAPDACRTSCLLPHCGDGTVDTGEQCDDGNFDVCDGCDTLCNLEPGVVCGDGVAAPACGEQCDDGNATLFDGCTPACTLERVPGGGPASTDCLTEWSIDNPTNDPALDNRGAITGKQRCVDGDPRCDFDGVSGSCTFHLRVCANNTDVSGCQAPSRISTWTLERPSPKDVAKRPELAAVHSSMLPAVPGAIIGSADRDVCTPALSVTVPVRGAPDRPRTSKLKLQTRATSYEGAIDKDKLLLECHP